MCLGKGMYVHKHACMHISYIRKLNFEFHGSVIAYPEKKKKKGPGGWGEEKALELLITDKSARG